MEPIVEEPGSGDGADDVAARGGRRNKAHEYELLPDNQQLALRAICGSGDDGTFHSSSSTSRASYMYDDARGHRVCGAFSTVMLGAACLHNTTPCMPCEEGEGADHICDIKGLLGDGVWGRFSRYSKEARDACTRGDMCFHCRKIRGVGYLCDSCSLCFHADCGHIPGDLEITVTTSIYCTLCRGENCTIKGSRADDIMAAVKDIKGKMLRHLVPNRAQQQAINFCAEAASGVVVDVLRASSSRSMGHRSSSSSSAVVPALREGDGVLVRALITAANKSAISPRRIAQLVRGGGLATLQDGLTSEQLSNRAWGLVHSDGHKSSNQDKQYFAAAAAALLAAAAGAPWQTAVDAALRGTHAATTREGRMLAAVARGSYFLHLEALCPSNAQEHLQSARLAIRGRLFHSMLGVSLPMPAGVPLECALVILPRVLDATDLSGLPILPTGEVIAASWAAALMLFGFSGGMGCAAIGDVMRMLCSLIKRNPVVLTVANALRTRGGQLADNLSNYDSSVRSSAADAMPGKAGEHDAADPYDSGSEEQLAGLLDDVAFTAQQRRGVALEGFLVGDDVDVSTTSALKRTLPPLAAPQSPSAVAEGSDEDDAELGRAISSPDRKRLKQLLGVNKLRSTPGNVLAPAALALVGGAAGRAEQLDAARRGSAEPAWLLMPAPPAAPQLTDTATAAAAGGLSAAPLANAPAAAAGAGATPLAVVPAAAAPAGDDDSAGVDQLLGEVAHKSDRNPLTRALLWYDRDQAAGGGNRLSIKKHLQTALDAAESAAESEESSSSDELSSDDGPGVSAGSKGAAAAAAAGTSAGSGGSRRSTGAGSKAPSLMLTGTSAGSKGAAAAAAAGRRSTGVDPTWDHLTKSAAKPQPGDGDAARPGPSSKLGYQEGKFPDVVDLTNADGSASEVEEQEEDDGGAELMDWMVF